MPSNTVFTGLHLKPYAVESENGHFIFDQMTIDTIKSIDYNKLMIIIYIIYYVYYNYWL